jgi:hypothetical protein
MWQAFGLLHFPRKFKPERLADKSILQQFKLNISLRRFFSNYPAPQIEHHPTIERWYFKSPSEQCSKPGVSRLVNRDFQFMDDDNAQYIGEMNSVIPTITNREGFCSHCSTNHFPKNAPCPWCWASAHPGCGTCVQWGWNPARSHFALHKLPAREIRVIWVCVNLIYPSIYVSS